jgi:RimJ/RimL family protein N-acetyltransferase
MITFRKATLNDTDLFFNWANDPSVRKNSYQKQEIPYLDHVSWFSKQISDLNNYFYVFLDEESTPIGQVRINANENREAIISLLIDVNHRGKGYAQQIIEKASMDFLEKNKDFKLLAYIFQTNKASYNSFKNAGYLLLREETIKDTPSYILYKNHERGY